MKFARSSVQAVLLVAVVSIVSFILGHSAVGNLMVRVIVLVFVAALAASWLLRRLRSPVERVKEFADRIIASEMAAEMAHLGKSEFVGAKELGEIAPVLESLADQFRKRLGTILEQKLEKEAVFSSMTEGVLAVDRSGVLLQINPVASRLLGVSPDLVGRVSVDQFVRFGELKELIHAGLESHPERMHEFSKTIELHLPEATTVQAKLSPLSRASDSREIAGVVLVLNDITRLRQLEDHRREFVANVSHELKTPLTSIQGFSETLLSQNAVSEEERTRFLKIIHRHATRLGSIVDDLLMLSVVEKEAEREAIPLRVSDIRPVLEGAIEACEWKLAQQKSRVEVNVQGPVSGSINPPLLEQAIVNLLDNAIKYSAPGKRVWVGARENSSEVVIEVRDEGLGIPKKHLPRLFERFYRVDRGRSRQDGGTGLGLAIVKHIVLAHHGRVEVESEVGVGTKFSVYLPKAQAAV